MFKQLILTILCLLGAGLAGRGIAASESGAAAVSGQQGVCRGVVVDTRGETVVGAYVLVSGTVRGTMTDASGVFTLDNVGLERCSGFPSRVTRPKRWPGPAEICA